MSVFKEKNKGKRGSLNLAVICFPFLTSTSQSNFGEVIDAIIVKPKNDKTVIRLPTSETTDDRSPNTLNTSQGRPLTDYCQSCQLKPRIHAAIP